MTFRKLNRSGQEKAKTPQGESPGANASGAKGPDGQAELQLDPSDPSRPLVPDHLARAATDILTALHASKQELSKEMEVNLKQLKSVLKETERIAKDMEAVLEEAQSKPDPDKMMRGGVHAGGSQAAKGTNRTPTSAKAEETWQPPGYKETDAWKSPAPEQSQPAQSDTQEQPPQWEPPQPEDRSQGDC